MLGVVAIVGSFAITTLSAAIVVARLSEVTIVAILAILLTFIILPLSGV